MAVMIVLLKNNLAQLIQVFKKLIIFPLLLSSRLELSLLEW